MNATTREAPPEGHLLNETEWLTLRALADVIVPPSETYGVPGAGDEAIAKTMVKDADGGRKLEGLIRLLAKVGDMAELAHGAAFYELSEDQRQSVGMAFQAAHPGPATTIGMLVTQCYYRDDRVVLSLGMDTRPPMPLGYEVKQGDWSLLDQVRTRDTLYRPAGD